MNLANLGGIRGTLPVTVGRDLNYFLTRGVFIDATGPLVIDAATEWGYGVRILTRSHDVHAGTMGKPVARGVTVEAGAWIGSFALLYNCRIGEGAIVAAGAVVRSCEVAPRVVVAGNPAQVIARWDGQKWLYVQERRRLLA